MEASEILQHGFVLGQEAEVQDIQNNQQWETSSDESDISYPRYIKTDCVVTRKSQRGGETKGEGGRVELRLINVPDTCQERISKIADGS